MGIKLFVMTLFSLSVLALFSQVSKQDKNKETKDAPLISFTEATMYTINHKEVLRIVDAKSAIRYKTRDEMYDSTIVTRVKDKNNKDLKDVISADKMVKKDDVYSFFNHVKYDRDDVFSLRTDEMYYDIKNEIAYNEVPFTSVYNNDILNGTHLYLDNKINFMKAKKAHFEIDMNARNKNNQGSL
ncbi:MAG: hypothetical protein WC141_06285 [Arcobacteraceae bacterium]